MSVVASSIEIARNPAIRIDGVTKDYHIYRSPAERLISLLLGGHRARRTFRALDDVSFEVQRGETLGIIGRNGAGKSTLLQILCCTLEPTAGTVEIRGRFAALLELGAGFNPDFTGRENVYMNASLLGLSRQEIDARLDLMRDFADIGDYFERPVKTYSSGMFVRLAFSVAVHTDPDVLIIDEALSVGDIRFQMKCLEKIEAIRSRGATVLFVSHSLEQVKRFCQNAVWIENGRVRLQGNAAFVTDRFREHELGFGSRTDPHELRNAERNELTPAFIETVSVQPDYLAPFEPFSVDVSYHVRDSQVPGFLLGVAIKTVEGLHIFGPNTHLERVAVPDNCGSHRVTFHVPALPLLSGTYRIDVGLFTDRGLVCLDYLSDIGRLTVTAPYFSEGLVYIPHEWKVHDP